MLLRMGTLTLFTKASYLTNGDCPELAALSGTTDDSFRPSCRTVVQLAEVAAVLSPPPLP